jgi:hypothetical protein
VAKLKRECKLSFRNTDPALEGDGLSFIDAAEGVTKNIKFDGKDYPNEGQDIPPGSASSPRRVNERSLEVTDKIKGKITDTQQIFLSPDLKTLTMTVLLVGRSNPNVLVFEREYRTSARAHVDFQ